MSLHFCSFFPLLNLHFDSTIDFDRAIRGLAKILRLYYCMIQDAKMCVQQSV